jgi:hypothetical protein
MYQRGNCPWMIWDPERSGQAEDALPVLGTEPVAVQAG